MVRKYLPSKPTLINWIHDHDDRWSFIIIYVGLAIILSLYAGLFWVMVLMLCHVGLEFTRYKSLKAPLPILHSLWQTKLDIFLLFFAFCITLYSDTIMAALGLGQSARALQATRGLQMAARFGIIESALRTFLLTADDLMRLFRALWKTSKKRVGVKQPVSTNAKQGIEALYPWRKPKFGDLCSILFGLTCCVLIFLAPILTNLSIYETLNILKNDLSPF